MSAAWFQARAGLITGSKAKDVLDRLKNGGDSAKRKAYKSQILAEILSGTTQSYGITTNAMQHGIDTEPKARDHYALATGLDVEQVGFCISDENPRWGASPDGLIGSDGLVEFKCPETITHIDYLLADVVPEQYIPQMAWQMLVCERQWCEFVSFDDRLPKHLQMFVKRYHRDNAYIEYLKKEVNLFLFEVDEMVKAVNRRFPNAD